jgi:hypothetical protein
LESEVYKVVPPVGNRYIGEHNSNNYRTYGRYISAIFKIIQGLYKPTNITGGGGWDLGFPYPELRPYLVGELWIILAASHRFP